MSRDVKTDLGVPPKVADILTKRPIYNEILVQPLPRPHLQSAIPTATIPTESEDSYEVDAMKKMMEPSDQRPQPPRKFTRQGGGKN